MERIEPSSWITFLRDIKGKNLSKTTISRKFYQQVDRKDYSLGDVPNLINHAFKYGSTKPS